MYSVVHNFIYNNALIQPSGAEGVRPSVTEAGRGRSNEAIYSLEPVKVVIYVHHKSQIV